MTTTAITINLTTGENELIDITPAIASDTVTGGTKLSAAPATTGVPIAVGDNDPRVAGATSTQLGLIKVGATGSDIAGTAAVPVLPTLSPSPAGTYNWGTVNAKGLVTLGQSVTGSGGSGLSQGTVFPTSPLNYDLFFRDDRGMLEQYYTGFSGPAADWYPVNRTLIDIFDRANSTTRPGRANTGQSWLPKTGTWGINGNRLYSVSDTNGDYCLINPPSSSFVLQYTISGTLVSSSVYRIPQVFIKWNSTTEYLYIYPYNGALRIDDISGMGSWASPAYTWADGTNYTITIVFDYDTLTAFVNGTQLVSLALTSTNYPKWTDVYKVGFILAKSGSPATAAYISNFILRGI